MFILNHCQQARSEVTAFLKLKDSSFAFCTKYHGAKIIDAQECNILQSYKEENLNFNTKTISFSPDSKLIAYVTKNYLYIASFEDKKIIKKIYLDQEDLTILSFDSRSKYIIAGTADGRGLLFKYNSNSQLSRLCSFPTQKITKKIKKNFVSAITLFENLLAMSGYGGAIYIIDIYTSANKITMLHGTSRKNGLLFLDENIIVCGDDTGKLKFISIKYNSVLKEINLAFDKIEQIVKIPKTNYLIVHGKTNTFAIIDTKQYKLIHSNYIEFEDKIESIEAINNKILIVCLKNQQILQIEIPSRDTLSSLILHNNLDEAYELIEQEPMLKDTIEHKSLEKFYLKAYKDAVNALINQNITLANQLVDIYKDLNSKKQDIKLLFQSFKNYDRFKTLYLEKKYALAYAMCSKFPALKMTKQYESMEMRWKETFTNAQRHILLNKPELAKALFNDYITVSAKRPIIQLILKHNDLFIEFLKALEKKDFKTLNKITKENELFTQMPIHNKVDSDMEKSIARIEAYIKKNRIDLAKKSIQKMQMTPAFLKQAQNLYKMCDNMQKLQELYKADDFYGCYELIDKYPHLCFSELGELLQNHWIKLMNSCEEYASKGNIEGVKAILGELITLDARKDRIGDLLRVSFQVQIKYFLSKKRYRSAQSVIYAYIDIFTQDIEVSSLMRRYEAITKTKLAITQFDKRNSSRYAWLHSKFIVG